MQNIPRWAWWVGGVSAFLLIALAAMLYGNDWWLSGILTVSVVAWLTGVLAAIYGPAERRAPILGAVAGGFLYVLFAVGPWFNSNVGPWLITTRALVQIETKWLGREQMTPAVVTSTLPLYYTGSTMPAQGWSGGYSGFAPQMWTTYPVTTTTAAVPSGPTSFVATGHWFCGWLAAGAGMLAAVWMARRGKRLPAKKEASDDVGENPFGRTSPTPLAAEQSP
jgi:hypothetical protein